MKRYSLLFVCLFLSLQFFVTELIFASGVAEEEPRTPLHEFVVAVDSPRLERDPHLITTTEEYHLFSALFEGLFVRDPETGKGKPGLAVSWTTNEENTVYTFTLRQAKWSDGEPVTAADVAGSWFRVLDPLTGSPHAWLLEEFIAGAEEYAGGKVVADEVGIRAVDRLKFQLQLCRPFPALEQLLPHQAFAVLPMHSVERYGESWTKPENFVCNGPFVLRETVGEETGPTSGRAGDEDLGIPPEHTVSPEHTVCTANPVYWDKERVFPDKLVFRYVQNPGEAFRLYINGEVDWNTVIDREDLERLSQMQSFHRFPVNGTLFLLINRRKPLLEEIKLRRSLTFALDRVKAAQAVDAQALGKQTPGDPGIFEPARGFVPSLSDYSGIEGLPEGSPERALRVLNTMDPEIVDRLTRTGRPSAGTEKGRPSADSEEISFLFYDDPALRAVAREATQRWSTILKIHTVLREKTREEYARLIAEGEFDIAVASWFGEYPDPHSFLGSPIVRYVASVLGWEDERFDALLTRAQQSRPGYKRAEYLEKAEARLLEAYILVPLFRYTSSHLIDLEKWKGWYPNGTDIHPLKDISLAGATNETERGGEEKK